MPFIDDKALGPPNGVRPGMIRPQWTEDLQRLYDRWRDVEGNPVPTASSLRGDEERIIPWPTHPPSPHNAPRRRGSPRSSRERISFIRRLGACDPCRVRKIKCKHLDLSVFEQNYQDMVQLRLLDMDIPRSRSPASEAASDTPALDALDSILLADTYYNPTNTPEFLTGGDSLSTQMSMALGQGPAWNGSSDTTTAATQTQGPQSSVAALFQEETSAAAPATTGRGPSGHAWPPVVDNFTARRTPCENCGQLVNSGTSCTECDPLDWSWQHDTQGSR